MNRIDGQAFALAVSTCAETARSRKRGQCVRWIIAASSRRRDQSPAADGTELAVCRFQQKRHDIRVLIAHPSRSECAAFVQFFCCSCNLQSAIKNANAVAELRINLRSLAVPTTTIANTEPVLPRSLEERCPRAVYLGGIIERAGKLLPAQGPISAFVFLNTLQALEDLPFDEGLARGARLFGCQPYLVEDRYRQKMALGRIQREDLAAVLRKDLSGRSDDPICSLSTRLELRLAMLE